MANTFTIPDTYHCFKDFCSLDSIFYSSLMLFILLHRMILHGAGICLIFFTFNNPGFQVMFWIHVKCKNSFFIIQIYSGITIGRVLNRELYTNRFKKIIYLHVSTDCFMKISLQSMGPVDWREIFIKQSVDKCK